MYQISESKLAGKKVFTIRHVPTGNYASVVAGYGGSLNEFVVLERSILLAATTEADFNRLTRKKFAGNQLFPYPNRVDKARYMYNYQHFVLPCNDDGGRPHALHGLIYNTPFEAYFIDELRGKLELTYQFKGIPCVYPFDIYIKVAYQLDVNSFIIKSTICNTGKTPAPVGYGWHPYINIHGGIGDCKIQLPSTIYFPVDDNLIPGGQSAQLTLFEKETAIGDMRLNHCFKLPENKNCNVTTLKDAGYEIQLKQYGYSYTQYYIPPNRKSIGIEPQTCMVNALNNGIGLIHLQSGETRDVSFEIIATKLTNDE